MAVLAARVLQHAAHGLERDEAVGLVARRRCAGGGVAVAVVGARAPHATSARSSRCASCRSSRELERQRAQPLARSARTPRSRPRARSAPSPARRCRPSCALLGMMWTVDLRHLEHAQRPGSRGSCSRWTRPSANVSLPCSAADRPNTIAALDLRLDAERVDRGAAVDRRGHRVDADLAVLDRDLGDLGDDAAERLVDREAARATRRRRRAPAGLVGGELRARRRGAACP